MGYQEFQPHLSLRPYIDAYWVVKGDQREPVMQRIYPDGCIDIILNLGSDFSTDSGIFTMKHKGVYLVGTMLRYKDTTREADTYLAGIRFKPLGFSSFYRFSPLHEVTEKTIDFDKKFLPVIHDFNSDTIRLLDKFFCDRLLIKHSPLSPILNSIGKKNGIISVEQMARKHFMTWRQLDRNFKRYLGISPKEYANFIRYQHAMQLIQQRDAGKSLLDIALDAGFYDHAHLTNEVKKYAGLLPSQL
jgi:AraC-like DNA-binding protein